MCLAGVLGTHGIVCYLVREFGTDEQQAALSCRALARGELRGGLALTEPEGGSDVANLHTARASATAIDYLLDGAKQFITNTHEGNVFAVRRAHRRRRRRRAVGVRRREGAVAPGTLDRGRAARRSSATRASRPRR